MSKCINRTTLSLIFLFFYSPFSYSAVLAKNKMWPPNTNLNVVFIGGTTPQKKVIKEYASLWLHDSSLSFSFFESFVEAPNETHIRIGFHSHTGSQLGNHKDHYSKQPTLLLSQLNQADLPEFAVKRIVLHEFGHALGFEHEYRNPKWPFGDLPINQHILECVPRMQDIGFEPISAKQKCREINQPLDKSQVKSTIYDESSIMNYPQNILLEDGTIKNIASMTKLSVLDKLAIQQWYGKKNY